jgi:hypothetical protein
MAGGPRSSAGAGGTTTVTSGGRASGINAILPRFGKITGSVTEPPHTAVAGECVTAMPVGKDFAGFYLADVAITTKTGGYSLLDLQPGRYKVKFSSGCGGAAFKTQWWRNAGSAAAAKLITVGAGATVSGIDARLRR